MECDWLRSCYSQTSHGMRISARVFFILKWSILNLKIFFRYTAKSLSYIYITEYWVEFPVLYSRSSLTISFIYSIVQTHGHQPTRLFCPWNFPGKSTGVGYPFLLQGIFPTQGLNPHLLYWQADPLSLGHLGSPIYICSSVYILIPNF